MNDIVRFFLLLFVMAGITYLVRMIPLVLVKKQIQNKFLLSFLYYIPYTVLASMTVPGVFFSTGDYVSASVGIIVAVILAFKEKSLISVSLLSSLCALVAGIIMLYV